MSHPILTRFSPAQAYDAVVQPAQRLGLPIDAVLVEEMLIPQLTDQAEQVIDLPMLQIVCDAWYRQAEAAQRQAGEDHQPTIGADAFVQLGDLHTVLTRHLDDTLREFQEPEQAREVLKALVSVAEPERMVKRAVFLEELLSRLHTAQAFLTPADLEQRFLRHLVQARLVRATEVGSRTRYELTHEFLVSHIAAWIATSERERTKVLEMIARAYEVYRTTNLLLPPEALRLIEPFQDILVVPPEHQQFLAQSSNSHFEEEHARHRTSGQIFLGAQASRLLRKRPRWPRSQGTRERSRPATAVVCLADSQNENCWAQSRQAAQQKRRGLLLKVATLLLAVALGFSIVLIWQSSQKQQQLREEKAEADRQRQEADRQRQEATSRFTAAEALRLTESGHDARIIDDAAALAVESWHRRKNPVAMAAALKLLPMLPDRRLRHPQVVADVAFRPDGAFLATASKDGGVRLFNPRTGEELAHIAYHRPIKWVQFSPDGRFLATLSEGKKDDQTLYTARLLVADTVRQVAEFQLGQSDKKYALFSPDSRFFAAITSENEIRLFALESGDELLRLHGSGGQGFTDLVFSQDSRFLAATLWRGPHWRTAHLISTFPAREISHIDDGHWVHALAFSPDGHFLAVASGSGGALVLSTATGDEMARVEHGKSVVGAAFSPDGRFLATASHDGTARLMSTATC